MPTVNPVTSVYNKLQRIFITHDDLDYRPVRDEDQTSPNAGIAQDVKVAEGGVILPQNTQEAVAVKVDLCYIPSEQDPLLVIPSSYRDGKRPPGIEREIYDLSDLALTRFRTLFLAVDLFNRTHTEGGLDKLAS